MAGLLYQHESARQKVRSLTIFALASFVLTSMAYFSCFHIATHSMGLRSFMHWLAYYPDASFTFNIWNDLGYTIRDHFRLFLSSRINLLQRLISPIIALLIAVLLVDLCLFVYLAFKGFRSHKRLSKHPLGRPLLSVSVLWILIYLVAVARQNDRLLRHREFRQ
jgi:hypothetical protein